MTIKTVTDSTEQFGTDVLLKISEVGAITGLGPSAIYSRIADKKFPAPVRLSARCSRWRRSSVTAWLESL